MMFESNHLIFWAGGLFAAGCARTNKEIISRVNGTKADYEEPSKAHK
jgi:hypothetical protein